MQKTAPAAFVQSIGLGFGASFMASIMTRAGSGGKLLLPKSEEKIEDLRRTAPPPDSSFNRVPRRSYFITVS